MTPSLDLKAPVSTRDLIDYVQAGHNLMIFGDVDSRKSLRNLFNEFGADLENVGFELRDKDQQQSLGTPDELIFSHNFFEPLRDHSKTLFSSAHSKAEAIAFSGIGHVIDSNNQVTILFDLKFVFPILKAEDTTYSYSVENTEVSSEVGQALVLVSGYQTRTNQRATLSGSMSMCSN